MKKLSPEDKEKNIDIAAREWFELLLNTFEYQKQIEIKKNEKIHH